MPKVTVDFSEIEDFEPIEKGEHPAMIEKITFVEPASEDKYPYLNVEVTLTEKTEGSTKAWLIWSLSPRALFRMKQDMENLGLPVDEIEVDYDEDTMLVTEPDLAGTPCIAVFDKPRTYEGRLQSNLVTILSADGGSGKAAAKKAGGRRAPAKKTAAKAGSGKKFK